MQSSTRTSHADIPAPLPAPCGDQPRSRARGTARVRPLWCMTIHDHTDGDRAAALRGLLRLPGASGVAVVGAGAVAPVHHRPAPALARHLGLSETAARQLVRVQFAKVAEYQRRGVIHFHALIRLDGRPTDLDPYPPPAVEVDSADAGRAGPHGRRPGRLHRSRRSTATMSRGGCGSAPRSTPARSPATPTGRPTGPSCTPRRSPPTSPSTPPKPPPTSRPTTTAATAPAPAADHAAATGRPRPRSPA